jgi:uncharacterized membrane-anchored protein YhcB (DUF1043 family)
VAYAGFLALVAAAIILLAEVIPWWLSALVIGLLVALVGYLLIQRGLTNLKQENLALQRTIETLRDDAEWAKRQVQ